MKKLFFSLVMLVTLVFVAGSAKAQTKSTPYPGGTYSYTVSGIYAQTGGTATITYSGSGATFSAITGTTIAAATTSTITFNTTYSSAPTAGKIRVAVTENGCTNFIEMNIVPAALPTYAVSITTSNASICQTTATTPADVTPASSGQTNNLTFTVTPSVSNVAVGSSFTYTYTVNLVGTGLSAYNVVKASGDGTCTPSGSSAFVVSGTKASGTAAIVPDVFTVTFGTTTGKSDIVIPGSLSAASMTIPSVSSTYNDITLTPAPSTVKALPTIGAFN